MRKIFLEKSYTKCGRNTIPRPSFEKSKLSISLDQYSKVLYSFHLLYAKMRAIECRSLAFISYKTFLKNKKCPGTSFSAPFSA